MKRLICLMRGHTPAAFTLSSTRLICTRCGIGLQLTDAPEPMVPARIETTIKRHARARLR